MEKTYLALVSGVPVRTRTESTCRSGAIWRRGSRSSRGRGSTAAASRRGTRWRVRARFEPAGQEGRLATGHALLELHPETGRQHQLRAHLAIGHPILGDKLYLGGDDLFLASLERALTAARAGCGSAVSIGWLCTPGGCAYAPGDGERVSIEAEPLDPRDNALRIFYAFGSIPPATRSSLLRIRAR